MAKEYNWLLLQDLLPRIPHLVKIKLGDYDYQVCGYDPTNSHPVRIFFYKNDVKYYASIYIKDYCPYLRKMSSMTKEERRTFRTLMAHALPSTTVEWLDKNHFDHRTNEDGDHLIDIGLALEAPDDMYEKEEQQ